MNRSEFAGPDSRHTSLIQDSSLRGNTVGFMLNSLPVFFVFFVFLIFGQFFRTLSGTVLTNLLCKQQALVWTEAKHTQKFQHREGSNENKTEQKVREPTNVVLFFFLFLDHEAIYGFYTEGKKKTRFGWRSYSYTRFKCLCLSTKIYRFPTHSTFRPLFTASLEISGLSFLQKKQLQGWAVHICLDSRMIILLSWVSEWLWCSQRHRLPPHYGFNEPFGPLSVESGIAKRARGWLQSQHNRGRSLTQLYLHMTNVCPLQLGNALPVNDIIMI